MHDMTFELVVVVEVNAVINRTALAKDVTKVTHVTENQFAYASNLYSLTAGLR